MINNGLKVAFICTLYAPNELGGAERAVRVLAEALVAAGHKAVVISLSPDGRHSTHELNGVTVYYVPLANIYWPHAPAAQRPPWRSVIWHLIDAYNPVMGARVKRILSIEKPDVVETNNLQGFSVAAWRAAQRLRIPVVQVLHDYYLGCPNSTMFRRRRNCGTQCTVCTMYCTPRRMLSGIPKVVSSVSRRTLDKLRQCGLFRSVRTTTIVPTAFDIAAATDSPGVPRRDKPPGSPLTIAYVGRIEPIKGVELLLRVVRTMPEDKVTLLLAGKGAPAYENSLRRQFSAGNIHFLGFVEPPALFARVDALVVPSLWEEPLGRVIFEGFAFGVPALVAKIGGMPELVEHDVTGYVFEAGDATGLARLLSGLMEGGLPSARLGAACQRKSAEFSIEEVLRAHMSDWQSAIAQQAYGVPLVLHPD